MAHKFYLNDCLPDKCAEGDIFVIFRDFVLEYRRMRSIKQLDLDQRWTLKDYASNTVIAGVPLCDLIKYYKSERDFYSYASSLVNGNPTLSEIESDMSEAPELQNKYTFNGREARSLLVAKLADMTIATVPIEKSVLCDPLKLNLTDVTGAASTLDVRNWYGKNREDIIKLFTPPLPPETEPLERLQALFGLDKTVLLSQPFIDKWERLGTNIQSQIVDRFETAYNANLLFPAVEDTNREFPILKRDQVNAQSGVYELRFKTSGIRVYLECDSNTLYLALYGNKGAYKGEKQNADFRQAREIVTRMREGKMLKK